MTPNFTGYVTKIVLNEDGTFHSTPGVDFETKRISVVGRSAEAIALRIEGHSVWNGNHRQRRHTPLEIVVCRIVSESRWGKTKRTLYNVASMITFSPNKPKPAGAG